MFFAGISGSATADASALGSMIIPAMKKNGFDADYAVAVNASSSAIGPIIPPSIMMVIYGSIANVSVAQLFLGGFVPGLIMGLGLMGVAYYIAKIARQRSRAALFLLCLIPLWVSDLVRAFGWIVLLRETGVISGFLQWAGLIGAPVEMLYNDVTVVIGLVYTVVLFMIVPLVSTLDGMDDALLEAGYNLGGSRLTVFRRIIVPYAMPGIVAGCIITFMLTAGSYLTPILLGGKNSSWFTEQIYNQFITRYNWEAGSPFGVLLLGFTSLVVWLGLKLTGQSLATTVARD